MSSGKVDEIWAKMKASSNPSRASASVASAVLKSAMAGDAAVPSASTCAMETATPQQAASVKASSGVTSSGVADSSGDRIALVVASAPVDLQILGHHMQRYMAQLKDDSSGVRRQALLDIQAALMPPHNPPPGHFLEEWADVPLYKALLRRFEDSSESNREIAVTAFINILKVAPQSVLSVLPYVIPVLEERAQVVQLPAKGPRESSEEVRLQLVRLLTAVVMLSSKAISAYAGEVLAMVHIFYADAFHEINIEACNTTQALNDALGLRLQPAAKELVAQLLPLCTHKRHKVRVAAIHALKPVMHQGAHEMILEMVAFRDPNLVSVKAFYGDDLKVNFCGKLASDQNLQVRLEFLRMLANWMLNLRERMDHEHRLLPYVMSALNDESPIVQGEALDLLEKLGALWWKDHESDLKETTYYLPSEAHGMGWQDESVSTALRSFTWGGAPSGDPQEAGRQLFVMPGPCSQRPSFGARLVVQANFGRAVHPLVTELTESWQSTPRLQAARLLRVYLVFCEDAVHQHLRLLVPAMCKAMQDPDLVDVISDCCAIIAAFSPPDLILSLIFPRANDEGVDLKHRAAAVDLVSQVIKGAGARGAIDSHINDILELLESDSFMRSEDASVRQSMFHVLEQLVSACGPACIVEQERLLLLILLIGAHPIWKAGSTGSMAEMASGTVTALAKTEGLAEMLAIACGYKGISEMVPKLRGKLLSRLGASSSSDVSMDLWVCCRLMLQQVITTSASQPTLTREGRLLFAPDDEIFQLATTQSVPTTTDALSQPPPGDAVTQPPPSTDALSQPPPGDAVTQPPPASNPSPQVSASQWCPDQAASSSVIVASLRSHLPTLRSQAEQSAVPVLLCYLHYLHTLAAGPAPASAPGLGDSYGLHDLPTLLLDLLSVQGAALLLALRCLHAVVLYNLLSPPGLAECAGKLGQALAGCLNAGVIPCRLQACYTALLVASHLSPTDSVASYEYAMSVLPALTARMHDAQDDVRCAALPPLERSLHLLKDSHGQLIGGPGGPGASAVCEAVKLLHEAQDLGGQFMLDRQVLLENLKTAFPVAFSGSE